MGRQSTLYTGGVLIDRIDGPRAAKAARLLGGILVGSCALTIVRTLVMQLMFMGDYDFEGLGALFTLLGVVGFGISVGLAIGARGYARGLGGVGGAGSQALLISAYVIVGIHTCFMSQYVLDLAGLDDMVPRTFWTVLSVVTMGAHFVFAITLSLTAARMSAAYATPLPDGLVWGVLSAAGLGVALSFVNWLDLELLSGETFHYVTVLLRVCEYGLLAFLLFSHAKGLAGVGTAEESAWEGPVVGGEWGASGAGLTRYANALVALVVISVVGGLLTVVASRGRSMDGIRGVMLIVPTLALVAQVAMFTGVLKYARKLPALSNARGTARMGAIFFSLSLLLSLIGVFLTARAFSSGRLGHLFDLMDTLPALEGFSSLVGITGLLCLIVSFDQVARELGQAEMAARRGLLKPGLVVLATLMGALKLGARDLGVAVLPIGIAVLFLGVLCLTSYIRYVRDLAATMTLGANAPS